MHDHHEREHPHGPGEQPKKTEQAEPTVKPSKPGTSPPPDAPAHPEHTAHEHTPGKP